MSEDVLHAGWIWLDVTDPNKLDRSKAYRIEIGRQLWQLRYRGLNEWTCFRNAGDTELSANDLIAAGCNVYVRREPIKFQVTCRVKRVNGAYVLDGLYGDEIPDALLNAVVQVELVEAIDVLDPLDHLSDQSFEHAYSG